MALRPIAFGEGRKLSADEPVGLATASAALLKRGSVQEAVEYAERAVELAPQLASAHRALGLALLKLPASPARRNRVIHELSSYLAGAPGAPDRAEIGRIVEQLRGDISIPPPRPR